MDDGFAELSRLIPAPIAGAGSTVGWGEIEGALGVRLPADYKRLVDCYGIAEFAGFLRLIVPQAMAAVAREVLEDEIPLREEWPDQYPYTFHPEPGGLLGWATTNNGGWICWLTEGEPDGWPIVVWARRPMWFHRHELGSAAFLCGWLTGRITSLVPPRHDEPLYRECAPRP